MLVLVSLVACDEGIALDDTFAIPRTESFSAQLSDYEIYQGAAAELTPAEDVFVYELSSELFTDYARKQRLVKLPEGTAMAYADDGAPVFPNGTVVAKTFYFDRDYRDPALGRDIIETRLMVLESGAWNVATYIWNEAQDDALLALDGGQREVAWISESGENRATLYDIPSEVACVTCHQSRDAVVPLGLTMRNMNHGVLRDDGSVNQLSYLQSSGWLDPFAVSEVSTIVDYKDTSNPLELRARAYLDLNCAHCHNAEAWNRSARQGLVLHYDEPLSSTGIETNAQQIRNQFSSGRMPYVGTTVLDEEGIELIRAYLATL